MHYEVLGRGRPIIFLHGWVGSWRYWVSSMQVASTSFRAYALDLWGFGDTAQDANRYALRQQVGLVIRFLEAMGIGKVALVGHGLGALVALSYTMRLPASVDRIMAVNCPMEFNAIHNRLRTAPFADLVDWLSSRTPAYESALADASKADPRAVAASINGLQNDSLFPRLAQFQIPCLLVHGQNDPAIVVPPIEQIISLPESVHQIVLEQSGHFPMLDETAKFNRLLTDFLALDSGVSPRELQLKEEWKRRVR